jgi:hypothetical protein
MWFKCTCTNNSNTASQGYVANSDSLAGAAKDGILWLVLCVPLNHGIKTFYSPGNMNTPPLTVTFLMSKINTVTCSTLLSVIGVDDYLIVLCGDTCSTLLNMSILTHTLRYSKTLTPYFADIMRRISAHLILNAALLRCMWWAKRPWLWRAWSKKMNCQGQIHNNVETPCLLRAFSIGDSHDKKKVNTLQVFPDLFSYFPRVPSVGTCI